MPGRYADVSAVPENGEPQDRTYIFKGEKDDLSFAVNYEDDVFFYVAKDRKTKKDEKPCEKDNEKPEKPAKTGENCVKNDPVEHPKHYISASGIETIDVIAAFTQGLDGEDAFCTGNAIKYLCRWPHKNGVEDLKKARWYIDRLIGTKEKSDKSDA
ncbi:MAG: DUF3310 domain-containing protein [Clostridia bacterium]|nr:DUF3310 domain-containing protein [Clostridia bacterium]